MTHGADVIARAHARASGSLAKGSLSNWIEPRLFGARRRDIKRPSIKSPDQEDLDIELSPDTSEHLLMNIPEGM